MDATTRSTFSTIMRALTTTVSTAWTLRGHFNNKPASAQPTKTPLCSTSAPSSRIELGASRCWFDPLHRADAIDRPVERGDRADAGGLRTGDQVCLCEVDPVQLVHLERTQQQRRV